MTTARRWRRTVATWGAVAGLASATGCSNSGGPPPVSAAATSCRGQWSGLAEKYAGRDQGAFVSDLSSRWNALLATADYYAAVATADDCDAALTAAESTAASVEETSASLRVYDVPFQMQDLTAPAADYLTAPRAGTTLSNGKRVRPPAKPVVRKALEALKTSGPAAVRDMKSGWDSALEINLSKTEAVTKLLSDMRFLAGDSAPYQSAKSDLAVLRRAARFVG